MNDSLFLCWSAAGLGTVHTLLGPDHYLPFVAMSRAGSWGTRKTLIITLLCGVGHVVGSILLGLVGVALGTAVFKLEHIESVRGDIAAWMMIGFGLLYFSWAVVQAFRKRSHSHWHAHAGTVHCHEHQHTSDHMHVHVSQPTPAERASMTPWILFTIFVFGPCEPLIPLLMYPAAAGSYGLLVLVTLIFALSTVLTMAIVVGIAINVAAVSRFGRLSWLAQPIAGLMVFGCGVAIKAGL